jgi:hypothetical protein
MSDHGTLEPVLVSNTSVGRFSHRTRMRWLVGTIVTICVVFVSIGLYFRSALRPIPPPLEVTEKLNDTYWPIFHTYSPAQKAHVLDGDFIIVTNINGLPDELKTAFSHLAGMHDFEMANPGENFQIADVIVEHGLPWRRLLFAGISNDKYFIHYEKGGRGHSYHVAVFAIGPERKVMFLWGGPGFSGAKDLTQLRTMVAAGAYADDRSYYW